MAPKKLVSATTTTFSHTFCAENPGKLDEVYAMDTWINGAMEFAKPLEILFGLVVLNMRYVPPVFGILVNYS